MRFTQASTHRLTIDAISNFLNHLAHNRWETPFRGVGRNQLVQGSPLDFYTAGTILYTHLVP